jgi:WD40 repeat protein
MCFLILLFTFPSYAAEPLPPLVDEGEYFKDFNALFVDKAIPYRSVAFSPDGKTLASGSDDGSVKLWDVTEGRLLRSFAGHTDAVTSVAFSPDGKTLASGSNDTSVKLWDVAEGRLLHSFAGHTRDVTSVAFSPDGKTLASGSDDDSVKLWDVAEGRLLHSFADHTRAVTSVAFSPDGKTLASGSGDTSVKLWDVTEGRLLRSFAGHTDAVTSVAFSPDGKTLATGSGDTSVKLWDVAEGRLLHSFAGHTDAVTSVAFSPDGKTLASGSGDDSVKLWGVAEGRLLHSFTGHTDAVTSVAFSPDGKTLASGSGDDSVKLWDVAEGRLLHSFATGTTSFVTSVAFSPDGKTLASGSVDGSVKLWDVAEGRLLHSFAGHTGGSVAFSPDGKTLATGAGDGSVKLWDVAEGRLLRSFATGTTSFVTSVAFSPDGKTLASGSDDDSVKLWDVAEGRLLHSFEGHTIAVTSVAFSPDGRTLASGSGDGSVKLWDVAKGRLLHSFADHIGGSVAFSPDGKTLATGSGDNSVKLWDVAKGRLLHSFAGHTIAVTSVAFSPDGKTLASGSYDTSVKLWDVHSQSLTDTLIGGAHGNWLSRDAKGKILRGDDGTLLLSSAGNNYVPTLPQSVKPLAQGALGVAWDNKTVVINSGETTSLKLTITNASDQPIYWVQPQTASDSIFTVYPTQIYILKPQETREMDVQISAFVPYLPEPRTETWQLKLVAPLQTETNITIPVEIHTPKLQFESANLLDDQRTLNVAVVNQGNQPVNMNTSFSLTIPGVKTLEAQTVNEPILVNGRIERAFVLPEGFQLSKDSKVSLDVRSTSLPFFNWDFPDQTVHLPRPPWQLYAALTVLLMFTATGIFYFRRYRHPLVQALGDQPASMLQLMPEQLPEAHARLQQTNRLATVLAAAAVSPQTLAEAISFPKLAPSAQATLLARRLGASVQNISESLYELHLPDSFPLNVGRLLLFFPKDTAAEDAFTQLKNIPQAQARIILIIGQNSEYQRKLYHTTSDTSNKWVAPRGAELTRLLLSPDADTALAEILAGQLSLQQISPYQIGGGVNKESVFFGRRDLVAQIINRDPANYLLVGGRQVGKSTLLKAIERRLTDNSQVSCHYLSLSNEVLIPRLAGCLGLPHTDNPEVLATKLDALRLNVGKRFVFLIDEADRFIQHEKANGYPILNVFRRLSEEGGCTFILTGFWQLYQHAVLDYQSPIRNFGELLQIGALEKEACLQLATVPMRKMNLSYASEAIVSTLVEQCGQRANLIAIACQELIKSLSPNQRVIESGDIQRALHHEKLRNALSGWVIGESKLEQQYDRMMVYATVTREDFSTGELLDYLQEQGLVVDTGELDRTLARLELAFILGQQEGRWFYRVPLFVERLRQDDPELRLATEVKSWVG